jgi:hypothetical protein
MSQPLYRICRGDHCLYRRRSKSSCGQSMAHLHRSGRGDPQASRSSHIRSSSYADWLSMPSQEATKRRSKMRIKQQCPHWFLGTSLPINVRTQKRRTVDDPSRRVDYNVLLLLIKAWL